ncbi:MAG TPA: hypothetical protein VN260_06525 [Dissulfurispiraceae bacterium]|nr:hypothetical protein [Dissulfurispiraceae bacterium]
MDRDCEKLCRVVKIADTMALHLGIGLQRNLELSDTDCRQIGMDNGKVRELIASFQKVYDEQKESLRV